MNYRHAYHAGNHTEVFKHAVLVLLIEALLRKPKPFTVLDTHAGIGVYDLSSAEAARTNEAAEGIGRIFGHELPAAARYLDIVTNFNPAGLRTYPGSPAIIRAMLRADDRLIACELHPEDARALRSVFRGDRRIAVHHRDGYEAISAFVPFPTRRGLVFVDPPFEARDEFETLAGRLNAGIRKWPGGIFAAWYPVKDRRGVERLRGLYDEHNPPTLNCEFLRRPIDGIALAGSGIVICNPPWGIEERLDLLCRDLLPALADGNGSHALAWWVREKAMSRP